MVNTVSLFVFLVAWIWQHSCAQVLLGVGQPRAPTWSWQGCVLLMGFNACTVPSHPKGPAFPSEENLPANTGQGREEQQELLPPNCIQDTETEHQTQSNVTI